MNMLSDVCLYILSVIYLINNYALVQANKFVLRVLVNVDPPFITLNKNVTLNSAYVPLSAKDIHGMENELFEFVLEKENVMIEYYVANTKMNEKIDMFINLEEGMFDAIIGHIRKLSHKEHLFSVTDSWLIDFIIGCKATKYNRNPMRLLNAYSSIIEHLVMIIFTLAVTTSYWKMSKIEKNSKKLSFIESMLFTFQLAIGVSVKLPKHHLLRIIAFSFIGYEFFTITYYQTNWISFLTYQPKVFILHESSFLHDDNHQRSLNTYLKQIQDNSENSEQENNEDIKFYSKISLFYKLESVQSNQIYDCFTEENVFYSLVWVFSKNHFLLRSVNKNMLVARDTGILTKCVDKYQRQDRWKVILNSQKSFTLEFFWPIFKNVISVYLLAFFIFLLEIMVFKIRKTLKNRKKRNAISVGEESRNLSIPK